MKIVHITHHYIDGWGYQDNLLPEYQSRQGDDVVVVSDNDHLGYMQNPELAAAIQAKGTEYVINGVRIRKIKCFFNTSNTSLLCKGLYRILQQERPDMILHHGVDSSSLIVAAVYKWCHKDVKLYVDNHADAINETRNKLWDFCYNKILLSSVVRILGKTVNRYFGVTPLRCDYLHDKFGVPLSRIGFLPIGCDTFYVDVLGLNREALRKRYGIPQEAFVVVSGGKMDASKGTLDLINAVQNLLPELSRLHLILFGKADAEVQKAADSSPFVTRFGWCDREMTLSLLALSDVACWPLLHTTLIEDAVACGIPLMVKASGNVRHFEQERSGIFLKTGDQSELQSGLYEIQKYYHVYADAARQARFKYSYDTVATLLKEGTGYGFR